MSKPWKQEEINYILENYAEIGAIGCAKTVNRTPKAITSYVYRHKLPVKAKIDPNNLKVEEAKKRHKEKVESLGFVLLEKYKGSQEKILHQHDCGYKWFVSPNNFHKVNGCPQCRETIDNAITYVYECYFPELNLFKIGITNSWNARKNEFGEKVELINLWAMVDRTNAQSLERYLLNQNKNNLMNTGMLKSGNTETFCGRP